MAVALHTMFHEIQNRLNENFRQQKIARRELRKSDIDFLENGYKDLSAGHDSQAWKHTIALLGALFKVGGAAFGADDTTGKMISGLGDFVSTGSQVFVKFSDGDMSKIQGKLEHIRESLSDDNRKENELQALLRELNEMIQAAIERANRMNTSPFNPS